MKKLTIETIVPALFGAAVCGYVLFRCARGAARIAHQVYVDFVSG